MKIILITLISILLCVNLSAGEILLKKSFLLGWQYSLDGGLSYNSVGFTGNNLKNDMIGNEQAISYINKYKNRNIWTWVLRCTGIGIMSTAMYIPPACPPEGDCNTGSINEDMLIVGLVVFFSSYLFSHSAGNNLKQGVATYNNAIQNGSLSTALKLNNLSGNKTIMLTLNYSFY